MNWCVLMLFNRNLLVKARFVWSYADPLSITTRLEGYADIALNNA
jgi:hypothetical protein